MHHTPFAKHRTTLAVLLCPSLVLPAWADGRTAADAADETATTVLQEVNVTGKRVRGHCREKDLTGLGKTVKTTETLDKQQVSDIRDLVRYDPGVAVVEQGRGASSGYSIRGVDKNRVATVVDGIAQAQS
ncbi:MAG: TonB-dependent receptor plug domain-containing protein [Conchiformibius sp.]|nr:TonB-dependent receptor plug domain-containing protein [Conchiformibius sp.]